MSDTVPCPECHQPGRVLDRFTVQRANGPVRYLRLQCDRPPSFLVTVEDLDDNPPANAAANPSGEQSGDQAGAQAEVDRPIERREKAMRR